MAANNSNRLSLLFAAVLVVSALTAAPQNAVATDGWRIIDGDYGAATRVGRIIDLGRPTSPGEFGLEGGAVFVMGSDNGGFSRSAIEKIPGASPAGRADWGVSWQPANGGRGFSASRCGGYEKVSKACSETGEDQPIVFGSPAGGPDKGGMHLIAHDVAGAPGWPASLKLKTLARITGLSVTPTGKTGRAPGLLYRVDGAGLSVSPDGGAQFFALPPHCRLNDGWRAAVRSVAADAGSPGRVVVASGTPSHRTYDVAGCWNYNDRDPAKPKARRVAQECSRRRIAWSEDVGPQVAASILATATPATTRTAAYDVDFAGGQGTQTTPGAAWRYASVAHLAVPQATHRKGATAKACILKTAPAQLPKGTRPLVGTVPGPACGADAKEFCHATRGGPRPVEQACRDNRQTACHCRDEPACRYPIPGPLTIDPRNGAIYAVARASSGGNHAIGILMSRDGRHWIRHGSGPFTRFAVGRAPQSATFTDPWPYATKPPQERGVKLLTHAGLDVAKPTDANALDLNANPSLLVDIGRISVAFRPCRDDVRYLPDANGVRRRRGHLTYAVAVQWRDPARPDVQLSDVFIGHEPANCSPAAKPESIPAPGPLVFRSSRGLDAEEAAPTAQSAPTSAAVLFSPRSGYRWLPEATPNRPTKLPLSASRARFTPKRILCRVDYHAAAVAPSDSRVVYAWAWSQQIAYHAGSNRPYREVADSSSQCGFLSGLWRSVDRGRTWHLAVGRHDPQALGEGRHNLRSVDLTVLPTDANALLVTSNPRRQIASGPGTSVLYVAATNAQVYSGSTGSRPRALCRSANGNVVCDAASAKCIAAPKHCRYPATTLGAISGSWCDKSRAHPDICALWGAGRAPKLGCSLHRRVGLLRCVPGDPAAPSSSKGGERKDSPVPAQCAHVPRWATLQPAWKKARDTKTRATPTRSLTARCSACPSTAGAAATNDVDTDKPAPVCCLVGRSMRHEPDPTSNACVPVADGNHVVAPTRTLTRGHSSGSVHDAITVSGKARPGKLQRGTFFALGMDDRDTGIAKHNGANHNRGRRMQFSAMSRWLPDAHHVFKTVRPDAIRAVVALAADESTPGRLWGLANGSGSSSDFLRVVQVDDFDAPFASKPRRPGVRIYPTLLPSGVPRNGAPIFANGRWSGRGLVRGHNRVRLAQGHPHSLLITAAPGVGVLVIPTRLLTETAASAWSTMLHGADQLLGPVARPIALSDGKTTALMGTCATDIAVDGNSLFITVGRAATELKSAQNPGCVGLSPGLYRAEIPAIETKPGAPGDAAWAYKGPAPVGRLIRAFNDPHAVAIHVAKRAENVQEIRVVIADWAGYGPRDGCKGALWLGTSSTPSVDLKWGVIRRTDAVTALHIQAPPADTTGRADIWYAISSQTSRGSWYGGDRIGPRPGFRPQQSLRRVPPSHAGVYRQTLIGFAADRTLFPPRADADIVPANCMTAPPFGRPGNRQVHGERCDDATGLCRMYAGVLPGRRSIGPANAGQMYSALTGRWGLGVVSGTVYGQGAWFLPRRPD